MVIRFHRRALVAVLLLVVAPVLRARGDDPAPDEGPESYLRDGAYLTACGPIACYVALRAIGVDSSLKAMAEACRWKKGELTTLEAMHQAILRTGEASSVPTQLPLDRLAALIGDGRNVAILPIRKGGEEINHAVCAVRARPGEFFVIDYPELGQWKSAAELANIWDGDLLLVSRKPAGSFWRENSWFFLPTAAVLGSFLLLYGARMDGRVKPKPAMKVVV
jgi:hypothetical protein